MRATRLSSTTFARAAAVAIICLGCPTARGQQARVPPVNSANRHAVLALYRGYYLSSVGVRPTWTGSVATGTPGTLGAAYRLATLRRINYYRAMSGLPGNVCLDPAASAKCQQAALMMAAEGNVSHRPPSSWRFYTAAAAEAAANSDLALDTCDDEGPGAIDRYIADDGLTNSLVGHRRWLLYAGTTSTGIGIVPPEVGSHPGTNATWVRRDGPDNFSGAQPAVAWPPAGYVPAPLVFNRWSFSYPNANFSRASVHVTKNGVPVAIVLEPLGCQSRTDGSGTSAGTNTLAWTLPGNTVDRGADEHYEVRVENVVTADAHREFCYPVMSMAVGGGSGGNVAGTAPEPGTPGGPDLVAYMLADLQQRR